MNTYRYARPMDNIAEIEDNNTKTPAQETTQRRLEFFNIYDVHNAITKHFDRPFKKLLFVAPSQITDGCIAEFYDDEMKVTIATCRVRFRNQYSVDIKTGNITVSVDLSDLSFKPLAMSISDALTARSTAK